MWASEDERRRVLTLVVAKFQTFGATKAIAEGNPIAKAMAGMPPVFALDVDVREVVDFILNVVQAPPKGMAGGAGWGNNG